jgi:Rrf2 family transcriptional regulator, nitric oxide-sensitive transcriptional repressor
MSKVLNISSASYIALHSIADIASCKTKINIKTISSFINIAEMHVAKIIPSIVNFGYLKSTRGPKGGLMFSKHTSSVTLLEIFELIEGSIQIDNCPTECKKCPFKTCIFGGLPQKMSLEFQNYMQNKTIEQFINENK